MIPACFGRRLTVAARGARLPRNAPQRSSPRMKLVYSAETVVQVAHMRNVLESVGIRCELRNYHLASALGEIPFVECWPQLWAVEERQHAEAERLVAAELNGRPRGPGWTCPECRESLEPQFTACWRCGFEPPTTRSA